MKWAWEEEREKTQNIFDDEDAYEIDLFNNGDSNNSTLLNEIKEENIHDRDKLDSKFKVKEIDNSILLTSEEIETVDKWRANKLREIDEHPIYDNKSKSVYIEEGVTVEDYLKSKRSKKVGAGELEKIKEIKRKEYEKSLDETGYKSAIIDVRAIDSRRRKKRKKDLKEKKGTKYIYDEGTYTKSYMTLLRNLGLTDEQFKKALGVLTNKEKAKLLTTKTYKQTKIGKGSPTVYINTGDHQILEFLFKFRIASRQILERAIDKPSSTLYKTLERMANMGLVTKTLLIGNKHIWQLTKLGAVVGELGTNVNKVKMGSYPKMFVENYVASCLYSNKVNILQLEDFPFFGRLKEGEIVRGETLYSEKDLKSSLARQVVELNSGKFGSYMSMDNVSIIREKIDKEFRDWNKNGGEAPDLKTGNEYMYILYPTGAMTNNVCIPDIVVQRPRGENGETNNIAVEVEIKAFKTAEMKSKMYAYKQDKRIYSKVIFVVRSSKIAEKIIEICSEIGFERYDIVPFIDDNGDILKFKEAWDL